MKKSTAKGCVSREHIDARIAELDDWRGKTLSRLRKLIHEADPDVVEEWKWAVPVWSHAGIICTGESYKKADKAHLRERGGAEGSVGALQLQPRGEHAARDRFS